MAKDLNAAETKLTQYLNEAYAKETELEVALAAHIELTTKPPYKKRLKEHLKETKGHARQLKKRIREVSGSGPAILETAVGQGVGRAKSLIKGPAQAIRGTGEAEKMLKNAKTEYWNEHEEIATYTAIETLAEAVGDAETAKLARSIRREEERMAKFLASQIPQLTKAVVREEVPAAQRRSSSSRKRRRSTSARAGSSSASRTKSSGSRAGSSSGSRSRAAKASSSRSSSRSRSSQKRK